MHAEGVARISLEQDLGTYIRDRDHTVSFQPKVRVGTGDVTSFEALARWQHPTKGLIPPRRFIALAEDSGLIIDLGRAVLLEACQQARRWRSGPHGGGTTASCKTSAFDGP